MWTAVYGERYAQFKKVEAGFINLSLYIIKRMVSPGPSIAMLWRQFLRGEHCVKVYCQHMMHSLEFYPCSVQSVSSCLVFSVNLICGFLVLATDTRSSILFREVDKHKRVSELQRGREPGMQVLWSWSSLLETCSRWLTLKHKSIDIWIFQDYCSFHDCLVKLSVHECTVTNIHIAHFPCRRTKLRDHKLKIYASKKKRHCSNILRLFTSH